MENSIITDFPRILLRSVVLVAHRGLHDYEFLTFPGVSFCRGNVHVRDDEHSAYEDRMHSERTRIRMANEFDEHGWPPNMSRAINKGASMLKV